MSKWPRKVSEFQVHRTSRNASIPAVCMRQDSAKIAAIFSPEQAREIAQTLNDAADQAEKKR